LSVGDCRQGRRDHDNNESKGAQFTHDVHSSLGLGVTTITAGVCSRNLQCQLEWCQRIRSREFAWTLKDRAQQLLRSIGNNRNRIRTQMSCAGGGVLRARRCRAAYGCHIRGK
jgi:hypothetical protein